MILFKITEESELLRGPDFAFRIFFSQRGMEGCEEFKDSREGEAGRIYGEIVVGAYAPFAPCEVVIVVATFAVHTACKLGGLTRIGTFATRHDTLHSLFQRSMDEYTQNMRMIAKHIIGSASYEYATVLFGKRAYHPGLSLINLLGAHPSIGISVTDAITEMKKRTQRGGTLLITSGKEIGGKPATFRSLGEKLAVVVLMSEAFSKTTGYLAPSATELTPYDDDTVHIHSLLIRKGENSPFTMQNYKKITGFRGYKIKKKKKIVGNTYKITIFAVYKQLFRLWMTL